MRRRKSGGEIEELFRSNREEVVDVFRKDDRVELAYVFGSVASGDTGELSDIDFAVFLGESVSKDSFPDVKMDLYGELSRIVGDEMDIVVMNEASALMNFNIVKTGEVLYELSRSRRARVESNIMRERLDRKYYDRRHADQRLESFAERGLA